MIMKHSRNYMIFGIILILGGFVGLIVVDYLNSSRLQSQRFNITYASEGQKIYQTGTSKRDRIPFKGGPMWLINRGGGCVVCHAQDGKGGIIPMMSSDKTPAITFKALTQDENFTEDTIKRAITTGVDEKGKELEWVMPRWDMTDSELDDVIEYLKELDQ